MNNFGNLGNMQKMLKQAQKMQEDMARLQESLKDRTVESSAGGGAVKVVATCAQEIQGIHLSKEAIDPEDPELLEDLLKAAVNEALRMGRQVAAEEMEKITGGMKLPGLT